MAAMGATASQIPSNLLLDTTENLATPEGVELRLPVAGLAAMVLAALVLEHEHLLRLLLAEDGRRDPGALDARATDREVLAIASADEQDVLELVGALGVAE